MVTLCHSSVIISTCISCTCLFKNINQTYKVATRQAITKRSRNDSIQFHYLHIYIHPFSIASTQASRLRREAQTILSSAAGRVHVYLYTSDTLLAHPRISWEFHLPERIYTPSSTFSVFPRRIKNGISTQSKNLMLMRKLLSAICIVDLVPLVMSKIS